MTPLPQYILSFLIQLPDFSSNQACFFALEVCVHVQTYIYIYISIMQPANDIVTSGCLLLFAQIGVV